MPDRPPPEPADIVCEPGGASYDPAASILDDARAAARRPWPYDMLPKDYLIVSGRYQRFRSSTALPAEPRERPQPTVLSEQVSLHAVCDRDQPSDPHGSASDPGPTTTPTTLPPRKRPPTDPRLRKRSFALRTKANTVRAQHPRQARLLDAQAEALLEIIPDDAPERARSTTRPPAPTAETVVGRDIDLIWLAGKRRQIERLAHGTVEEQERARGLLALLTPVFQAVGEPLPIVPPPARVIVLADHHARSAETQDVYAADSTSEAQCAA
ncbi:MAG TPA: hypothetical protein VFZ66_17245 [Herpetosiphonaceae bacterium]